MSTLLIKRLSDKATIPSRATDGAAGYDLTSAVDTVVPPHGKALCPTDLSFTVPEGTCGRIAPRSGLAWKQHIDIGGGIIDRDFRGNVGVILFNHSNAELKVSCGDRIAQLIIEKIELPTIQEVEELPTSVRGEGGFGSTGTSAHSTNQPVAGQEAVVDPDFLEQRVKTHHFEKEWDFVSLKNQKVLLYVHEYECGNDESLTRKHVRKCMSKTIRKGTDNDFCLPVTILETQWSEDGGKVPITSDEIKIDSKWDYLRTSEAFEGWIWDNFERCVTVITDVAELDMFYSLKANKRAKHKFMLIQICLMYPQRKTAQHTNVETTNADGGKTTTNHFGNMSKLFVNCRVMPTTNKIKKQRSATHVEDAIREVTKKAGSLQFLTFQRRNLEECFEISRKLQF